MVGWSVMVGRFDDHWRRSNDVPMVGFLVVPAVCFKERLFMDGGVQYPLYLEDI